MRKRAAVMLWIGGMALASFLVTFGFVDRLALPRDWFVLAHVLVTGSLLGIYTAWSRTTIGDLVGDWRWGLAGATIAGSFMIWFVLVGPSSSRPNGLALTWALIWLGLTYGTIDALLLSVFPVVASRSVGGQDLFSANAGRFVASLVALALSLLLTVTYHLGFPEFRGAALVSALIGNGIMTLSYLGTRSALSPVLAHIALHVATVLHGYVNALPAPPHY